MEEKNEKSGKGGKFHNWSPILSLPQASSKYSQLPPPYIHPLVQKSARSMSDNSLEMCTESIRSESGSVGGPSGTGYSNEIAEFDSCSYRKKSPPRSFPAPLPSLSRVHSHRENGRLVLQVRPQRF